MALFITSNGRGDTFTRNPKVSKAPIGYVIDAYCNDPTKFGGKYVSSVGFRDSDPKKGKSGWKLRRDALAAMAEAIDLQILRCD